MCSFLLVRSPGDRKHLKGAPVMTGWLLELNRKPSKHEPSSNHQATAATKYKDMSMLQGSILTSYFPGQQQCVEAIHGTPFRIRPDHESWTTDTPHPHDETHSPEHWTSCFCQGKVQICVTCCSFWPLMGKWWVFIGTKYMTCDQMQTSNGNKRSIEEQK